MAARRSEREREIDDEIVAFESIAADARAGDRPGWTAVVAAQRSIAELRRERARLRAMRIAESVRDPVKRLRAIAAVAHAEGSWTAAERLDTAAAGLEVRQREIEAEIRKHELDHVADADLVAMIVDVVELLPPVDVEAVVRAIEQRPDGAMLIAGA